MSKWTEQEEFKLLKDVSRGTRFETIAASSGRSVSAIELRFKKIIYRCVVAGKSYEELSSKLNLPVETIRQYFYVYKDYNEKNTGQVDPVLVSKNIDNVSRDKDNAVFSKFQDDISKLSGGGDKKETKQSNVETKIKHLEKENQLISLIVENRNLHSQLNKLIKSGKIDPNIKTAIKNIK